MNKPPPGISGGDDTDALGPETSTVVEDNSASERPSPKDDEQVSEDITDTAIAAPSPDAPAPDTQLEDPSAQTAAEDLGETDLTRAAQTLELRLSLVCYGGISLAVYMHGVSREILNLVRASKAYHDGVRPRPAPDRTSFDVYLALLETIGAHIQIRVIVDIIAGASAGGINGIMLARALAYDLPLDDHRKMWLELADVTELLEPSSRASVMSKPFMRPVLGFFSWQQQRGIDALARRSGADEEVRHKLSLFTRSRWFHPPFSGMRMTDMMLDGLAAMGKSDTSRSSLLPPGHRLDLFVTSTDFHGHRQILTLHDPLTIIEKEHRQVFRFSFDPTSEDLSDAGLADADIPALAFAARATSSFPGAFPPTNLAEMDTALHRRNWIWPKRDRFITAAFAQRLLHGEDIDTAPFIDGSVLMNKPLDLAIDAVRNRSASRQVDRRIVYIDPNPETRSNDRKEMPGFFETIRGALSDIPRNQPIRDDLEQVNDMNRSAENLQEIVTALQPRVLASVQDIRGRRKWRRMTPDRLGALRFAANAAAAEDASYVYGTYARLKVLHLLDYLTDLLSDASQGRIDRAELDEWVSAKAILPIETAVADAQPPRDKSAPPAPWVQFLRNLDDGFRLRRIRFVLRQVNQCYRALSDADAAQRNWLDEVKSTLYMARGWFSEGRHIGRMKDALGLTANTTHVPQERIEAALATLMDGRRLVHYDQCLDAALSELAQDCPDKSLGATIIDGYLGFAFFDVATFPMTQWRDLTEMDAIRVDRISANDANCLDSGDAGQVLKGAELSNFGAFFSRAYRENDFLWGRLSGAERLFDIVESAAPGALAQGARRTLLKSVFGAILAEERGHLKHIDDLFSDLEDRVARLDCPSD